MYNRFNQKGNYTMPTINELMMILQPYFAVHKSRLNCLAQILVGLLTVRTVNLVQLAQAMTTGSSAEARYKRLRRFFAEFTGFTFENLSKFLLAIFNLQGPWQLSMDRTNWRWGKSDINILMLSVKCNSIAIPVIWRFLSKKGNSNFNERVELIEGFIKIFGERQIEELLCDREFGSSDWFKWLQAKNIHFTIRIKQNILVSSLAGNTIHVHRLFGSLNAGKIRYLRAKKNFLGVDLYLAATRAQDKKWVIVATSYSPEKALERYAERWYIETLFGFLKSKGFNFEDTHITLQPRLHNLLAVLTIAFCFAYKAGLMGIQQEAIKLKRHGRPAKSIFRVGLDALCESVYKIKRTVVNFFDTLLLPDKEKGIFSLIFSGG